MYSWRINLIFWFLYIFNKKIIKLYNFPKKQRKFKIEMQQYQEKFKDKNLLILGGLGFVGKNLLEYCCENNLFKRIVTADKQLP